MSANISNTLRRLARRLFSEVGRQTEFMDAVTNPPAWPVATIWMEDPTPVADLPLLKSYDWLPDYVRLIDIDARPGRHELHQNGAYYCADPSSVFMAMGMSVVSQASVVVDLCAAPGGKSVIAARALQPDQLYCNEVIGKRLPALVSNLRRCRIASAVTTNVDSARFAEFGSSTADVVLVDAPCSGQSLVARGKPAPGCFHPATINMNANRQRRILANATQVVAPDGILIYMTCTFSQKENERNVEWLLRKNSDLKALPVPLLSTFQSHLTDVPCYRLWPMAGQGAGGFVAVFQRTGDSAKNAAGDLARIPARPIRLDDAGT